jgi:hypothetical protein
MAWSKSKIAVAAGVVVLLAAGFTLGISKYEHAAHLERVQGTWEGTLQFRAGDLMCKQRILLRIFRENGSYHAAFDEIDNGRKNLPATKFTVGGSAVNFESGSDFVYQGKLNRAATEIAGRWRWLGSKNTLPLTLTRTATPDGVQEPMAEADYAPRTGSDLQGFWKGTLKVGTATLRLHLKIAEAQDGTFRAELNSIDQPPVIPLPVTTLDYGKPAVKFSLQGIGAEFQGRLDEGGTRLIGHWTQVGTMPLTFTRADPKAETQALEAGKNYDYDSATELQGHWSGTLSGKSGRNLRLVFHIAQLSDGSLTATMDSLDQSLFAMPFDTVQYTPPKTRLEMKSAQCVFEGTLTNGKLSGVWIYKASPAPLTLERNTTN